MTDPRMTPTNDAPVTVESKDRYANDQLAELIYNSWSEQPGWVPWRERGNSNMQEKARREAERSIGSALATADDRREALALIARGVLGVDIGKAFAKAGDTFDLPIAVDCVADALARTRLAALASAPAPSWSETPEHIREHLALLAEVELHLKSSRVFVTTREKMHPCGVELHDELLGKVTAAIETIGKGQAHG